MSDPDKCPTIQEVHIRSLHSIVEHLCNPELVSVAMQNATWKTVNVIQALKKALEAKDLPTTTSKATQVSKTTYRGRVELLLPLLLHSEFWERAGLTRDQLCSIEKAFANAPERPDTGAIPVEYCTEKMHRDAEIRRTVKVNKVLRKFKAQ